MIAMQYDLFEDVERLPWQGRSPRFLTKAAKLLFLERERGEQERFFVDPNQYDCFRRRCRKKAPRVSRGAPLLVPLGMRRRRRK